uniref:Regulator of microtubule dynamics protein 1 n=1 Tax=Albugo laibachii Nc14 TaxID=890382 RepID=F0W4N7_9STRA|nr:regulator of microtubule dynamics protein putative [Albugo laibachii Nc14]|eukprot:CCA16071.1 regulator of microtubule dynamics protein putative [Albugo laibachii Nc14]
MVNRGLLWSILGVAGSATAIVIAYRYLNTPVIEETNHSVANSVQEDVDEPEEVSKSENIETNSSHQLSMIQREGSLFLSLFSLIFMLLVGLVGFFVVVTSNEASSVAQLPMFPPLMWITIGMFAAASVEIVNRNNVLRALGMTFTTEKAVFPNTPEDFNVIRESSATNSTGQNSSRREQPDVTLDEEKPPPTDLVAVIDQADELFEQDQHDRIRTLLKSLPPALTLDVEVLWRRARACNYLIDTNRDQNEKRKLAYEGLECAEAAYSINPSSATSNKWMAIMTSSVGNFRDTKEKIAGAYVIRDHIQRAIELDPLDATSHNILGQWCLAFADMSWFEKKAAAALFGKPPTATYEDALEHFFSAENISPGFWKRNAFLIAQTMAKLKRFDEAQKWTAQAKGIEIKTAEDKQVQESIIKLERDLRNK